jgi:hypothetical protein
MGKRKRPSGRRGKQSSVQELTFDSTDDDFSGFLETQSFTFLASGSGRKARTTHVHGRRGLPDSEPGSFYDAPTTSLDVPSSAGPASVIDEDNREDVHSDYADSDFFTAFDASEMHFGADDSHETDMRGNQGGEFEEATEKVKEILAGVSHLLLCLFQIFRLLVQSYKPEQDWLEKQTTILDELVRLEGRGEYGGFTTCGWGGCMSTDAVFRCKDCVDARMHCQHCMVAKHDVNPFHRIQVRHSQTKLPQYLE